MLTPLLTLHSAAGKGYIGRLTASQAFLEKAIEAASQSKSGSSTNIQTVFILDRSGSMGQWVARLVNIVLPALAREYLKMDPDDVITLITFDSVTETIRTTVEGLGSLKMQARGCTNMKDVPKAILNCLPENENPSIRILAISDGAVWDTEDTLREADIAATRLKDCSVSATAVRLFTSSSQPDTRALASVLQYNTESSGSVIDVRADPNDVLGLVDVIGTAANFANCYGPSLELTTEQPCLRNAPWADPTTSIQLGALKAGKPSSLWLDAPPEQLAINGFPVEVQIGDPVTHDTLNVLLEDKIAYFLDRLRVLKVVNSPSSKEKLMQILNYFQELESNLPPPEDLAPLLQDRSLAARTKFMKASLARRIRSVAHTMETIANDERIAKLNAAQQADYLRQANTSGTGRTTRGLARRADACGTDFAATMRAEILSMAAHFQQALGDVKDSGHAVSFYSQGTTIDGIRCLIELANDMDILENLTAPQMLRLFNVVGIPAVGPIGDFPDPMTYRFDKLLYGAYVSVADLSMVWNQGSKLMIPGGTEEIVTAIPTFDDIRVQKFLQRYARSSLEYIASIGMRRMIAEVPKTYPYTMCAGIWKLIEELDQGKQEVKIQHLNQLVYTYENAIEGYFDHISDLLEVEDEDPSMSFYLGHNGITNLIAPILRLVRNGTTEKMPRILRALYSFETYQVMRRKMRDGGLAGRRAALDAILGVNLTPSSAHTTPLPKFFERHPEPVKHCSEAKVDMSVCGPYLKALWFVHYCTLLEPILEALINNQGDFLSRVRAVPTMSTTTITAALGLPDGISLDDFMLFNVVEGLLYGDKQSRIDKETDKPKLGDLGYPGVGQKMVSDYVQSRYAEDYESRLKQQFAQEQRILQDELIDILVQTQDLAVFCDHLVRGHTRGAATAVIDRNNSPGFHRLHERLMDKKDLSVAKRVAKLKVIYSGVDLKGAKVFNGGNLLRTDWKPLQALLESMGKTKAWLWLQNEIKTRGYLYRGGAESANRHGHSNDLPSYFAFKCQTLDDFRQMVTTETWQDYVAKHTTCCGVSEYLAKHNAASFVI